MSDEAVHFDAAAIEALDPARVADAMAEALGMVARGAAVAPIRGHIDFGEGAGTYLISGALTELDLLSVKVINVRPANAGRGLARLQGSLAVFEASTGRLVATLDARAATASRTAACSAVSLRLLARPDARVLTVFGTGPQARSHLRAFLAEREFTEIRIVGHGRLLWIEFKNNSCLRFIYKGYRPICHINQRSDALIFSSACAPGLSCAAFMVLSGVVQVLSEVCRSVASGST